MRLGAAPAGAANSRPFYEVSCPQTCSNLKLHDYSELAAAGRLVETVPESRNFSLPEQETAYLGTKIGGEIMRIEDPRQLSILQSFSLSSNYWLRQNATYALRHLHDFSNVRVWIM